MYNEYFGFKEAPFSIAPDPRYLYMTAQHRDALAHLIYGLNSEGGCILLTGEVGTGKTTICRCLLEQIPDQANVALVLNPKVSEIELLETICDELKIDYPDTDNSVKTYTDRIYDFLIDSNRNNEKTVLIIDEAQNLNSNVLEQLRLLTNLETHQRKLLQIIILGQPELLDILARAEMRQLAQRITARFHLQPLTQNEVKAYISHRLAVSGQNIQLFPEASIKLIFKLSKGIPRLINVICDRSLLGAYVENSYSAQPSIVKKAAREVFGELKNVEKNLNLKKWMMPAFAVLAIALLSLLLFNILSAPVTAVAEAPGINQTSVSETDSETASATASVATSEATSETSSEIISADDDTAEDSDSETLATPGIVSDHDAGIKTGRALTETVIAGYADMADIVTDSNTDTTSAYQQLFKTWGKHYDTQSSVTACKQAEALALSCLHKQGNLNSLKTHNRPAVLNLVNRQGENRYVTVTALGENTATIYADSSEYQVRLSDLNQYWYGRYTLLWKKPQDYSTVITPGESGNIINWLQSQLYNADETAADKAIIYNDELKDRVKRFQAQHGLFADGIVGPVTIIHLNSQSGMNVPKLAEQS